MSITPKQLSQEIEPVGICVAINGNKAMVRYRKEANKMWAAVDRFELEYRPYMNNGVSYTYFIKLDGEQYPTPFTFKATTRADFVRQLNDWFRANNTNWSAELVELDTDLPAFVPSDNKDKDCNYLNRIIINAKFIANAWHTFQILQIIGSTTVILSKTTRVIGKHIKAVANFYKNNGFLSSASYDGGCCRAKYYDFINQNQVTTTVPMTSIDSGPNSSIPYAFLPVKKTDFEDISNSNCKILRDNFATYEDYLESRMIKLPCSAGGAITEFPSGKEDTYKLANCTFEDVNGVSSTLYPAANHAASINIEAPGLEKGNWWLPSVAEMVEMMRDVTFHTRFWGTNPDIVNIVLDKMFKFDGTNWSMLSPANMYLLTSSRFNQDNIYGYYSAFGTLKDPSPYQNLQVYPITIYEF